MIVISSFTDLNSLIKGFGDTFQGKNDGKTYIFVRIIYKDSKTFIISNDHHPGAVLEIGHILDFDVINFVLRKFERETTYIGVDLADKESNVIVQTELQLKERFNKK